MESFKTKFGAIKFIIFAYARDAKRDAMIEDIKSKGMTIDNNNKIIHVDENYIIRNKFFIWN